MHKVGSQTTGHSRESDGGNGIMKDLHLGFSFIPSLCGTKTRCCPIIVEFLCGCWSSGQESPLP